jgi:23S rRNA pseudouridine955/2504/2580 synthase
VLKQAGECVLLECSIETGRTHQIRRHLAALGHPVVGDRRYGDFAFNRQAKQQWGVKRLFLHAEAIEFPHPADGRKIRLSAALPRDLKDAMERIAPNLR